MSPSVATILAACEQFGASITELNQEHEIHSTWDSTCSFGSRRDANVRSWRVEWAVVKGKPTGPDMIDFFAACGIQGSWVEGERTQETKLVTIKVYDSDFVTTNGSGVSRQGVVLATTTRWFWNGFANNRTGASPHIFQNADRKMEIGMFA